MSFVGLVGFEQYKVRTLERALATSRFAPRPDVSSNIPNHAKIGSRSFELIQPGPQVSLDLDTGKIQNLTNETLTAIYWIHNLKE